MIIEDQAIAFLSQDALLHIDMIEAIRRGDARVHAASGKGVLLYHPPAGTWMMSTADQTTADVMIEQIIQTGEPVEPGQRDPGEPSMLVAHQDFYIEHAQIRLGLPEVMSCRQAAYFLKELLPTPPGHAVIRQLDPSFLTDIQMNYTHAVGEDYLRERLSAGVMHGAFIDGHLAGFAGVHAEGSLGMLEVLPEFRRRGVAMALQAFMTNWHLSLGYVPFAQIKTGNTASIALQRKSGFVLSAQHVAWLM